MSLKHYLTLMSIGTILCWVAWFFVIFTLDPSEAGILGFLFFYLSLFFAIVGTFSVIGFIIRRLIVKNDDVVFRHVRRTFRQSIIIASLTVLALYLSSGRLLRWWNVLLLILFFIFLEAFIFTNRKFSNSEYVR